MASPGQMIFVSEAELRAIRKQADEAMARKTRRFIDLDPRTVHRMLNEIENHRVVGLTFERPKD